MSKRAIYLLSILTIIAIAVNIAYFTNMSETGLKIIAMLGIPLLYIIAFMICCENTPVNKYTKHR
jgi:hypothetical protein